MIDFAALESTACHAIDDFKEFVKEYEKANRLADGLFFSLPFEMQIGVFLKYFRENAVEIDLHLLDDTTITATFEEAFLIQENNLNHFS